MSSGVASPEASSGGGRPKRVHHGAEKLATAFSDPHPPGGETPPKVWPCFGYWGSVCVSDVCFVC